MYPDDSVQSVVGDSWWIQDDQRDLRGRLLKAAVPHVDQQPLRLVPEGRTEAADHTKANYRLEQFHITQPARAPTLPVAALPQYPGENLLVYRTKVRPVLVISAGGPEIPRELRAGAARWQTAPTMLVAPYYGADPGGTRGGFKPAFVERIRHAEYPQYAWDKLPLPGSHESILRLDHVQPVGRHHDAYERTPHRLTDDAMTLIDEWLLWLQTGKLDENGFLFLIRSKLTELGSAQP